MKNIFALTLIYLNLLCCSAFSSDLDREYRICRQEYDPEYMLNNFLPDSLNYAECKESKFYSSSGCCLKHILSKDICGIDDALLSQIPFTSNECLYCNDKAIYYGYIDPSFKRYSSHVTRQISYSSKHPECTCYWPELSQEAVEISNKAYELFQTLWQCSAFNLLTLDDTLSDEFRNTAFSSLTLHQQCVHLTSRQFKFSNYHRLTSDLESFSQTHFDKKDHKKIKSILSTILKVLSISFANQYEKCLNTHPNDDIKVELSFTKNFLPNEDDEDWLEELEDFENLPYYPKIYKSPYQLHRDRRLLALNVRPLFKYEPGLTPQHLGQDKACFIILKNLIHELYKDYKFYKSAKLIIPDLEEKFIEALVSELTKSHLNDQNDLIKNFTKQNFYSAITIAQDLDMIKLENNTLNMFRYDIFVGSGNVYWDRENPRDDKNYYSLLEFITLQESSAYLASLWMAPRPLLMALFQNIEIVNEVIQVRNEIYDALEQGDDRLIVNDELRRRFSDKLGPIDPKFIDFRVNRVKPFS